MVSAMSPPTAIGQYLILEELGAGSFARVYRCEHMFTHKTFAGKLYEVDFAISDDGCKLLRKEISIMKLLRHPHVIHFQEVVSNRSWMLIVMELVEGRTLLNVMPPSGGLPESFARPIMKQILDAMVFLHCNGIVHRDIKLENIMIQNDGSVKVIDFGLADHVPEEYTMEGLLVDGQCGSPHYYSPEMILASEGNMFRGDKVDIWAIGILLYSLVTGFHPFSAEGNDKAALFGKILGDEAPFENDMSKALENLLRKILVKNPAKRTTLYEMRNHPWMNDIFLVSATVDASLSRRTENSTTRPHLASLSIQTDCSALKAPFILPRVTPSNRSVENKGEIFSGRHKRNVQNREEKPLPSKRRNKSSSIIESKFWKLMKDGIKELISSCKKCGSSQREFLTGSEKLNSSTLAVNGDSDKNRTTGTGNRDDRNSFVCERFLERKSPGKGNDENPHSRIYKIKFACWVNV